MHGQVAVSMRSYRWGEGVLSLLRISPSGAGAGGGGGRLIIILVTLPGGMPLGRDTWSQPPRRGD